MPSNHAHNTTQHLHQRVGSSYPICYHQKAAENGNTKRNLIRNNLKEREKERERERDGLRSYTRAFMSVYLASFRIEKISLTWESVPTRTAARTPRPQITHLNTSSAILTLLLTTFTFMPWDTGTFPGLIPTPK